MLFHSRDTRMTQVPFSTVKPLWTGVLGLVEDGSWDFPETTWHFATFHLSNRNRAISCASYMFEPLDDGAPAWRLNSFATEPLFRGRRIGLELLKWSRQEVVLEEYPWIRLFHCRARARAIDAYLKDGWERMGQTYPVGDRLYQKMRKSC